MLWGRQGHALPSEVRLLLGEALGCSLIMMALLQLVFETYKGIEKTQHQTDTWLKVAAGLTAISIAGFAEGVGSLVMLALLSGLVVVVVGYIVRVWVGLRIKEAI
jgi:small-conductance mechanosensitive channel